jgi:hypothetical protein
MTIKVVLVAVLGLVCHLLFGWMWTGLAAVVGGLIGERRGWLIGLIGLVLSWGAILIYQYVNAPQQIAEMARVVATLVGGLPAAATYLLTLIVAALLGSTGGAVGGAIRPFFYRKRRFA